MPSDRPAVASHYMVDIETLGTHPTSAVIGIGGVKFDPWATLSISKPFSSIVGVAKVADMGFGIDGDTLEWWTERHEQWVKWRSSGTPVDPREAAYRFYKWVADEHPLSEEMAVWCFGASFDFPILENFMRRCGQRIPWKYYNTFCARTVMKLAGMGGKEDWDYISDQVQCFGVCKHDPLRDAACQALAVQLALRKLTGCAFKREEEKHGLEEIPRV